MLRYLIGTLVVFLVATFVRSVWSIIQKAVVDEVKSAVGDDAPQPAKDPKSKSATADTTLRKCATCATYKPESTMIRYGSGPKSVFFCSAECEKKANS